MFANVRMGRTWKGTTNNSSGFVPGRGLLPETARPVRPNPSFHHQRSDLSSLLFLLLLLSLLRGLPNLLTARTLPLLSWLDVSHSMLGKLLLLQLLLLLFQLLLRLLLLLLLLRLLLLRRLRLHL